VSISRRRPASFDSSWRKIAWLILGIGGLIVAGGVALGWGSLRHVLYGERADGEVIEIRRQGSMYAPVVRFRLPGGDTQEVTRAVSPPAPPGCLTHALLILLPSFAGEVSASHADGGVRGPSPAAHDPSVRDYADTSPAKLGRRMRDSPGRGHEQGTYLRSLYGGAG
jgi:hypothetical protein